MTTEEPQYEVTEVKAIRGTEAKTITNKQQDGWELVTQQQGRLRTTLTFRRPKPKTPWRLWAALGGAGVVIAGVLTVVALQEDGSDASTTEAVATPDTEQPTPEPAPEPEAEPAVPETTEILTIDNNEDLARILQETDYCSQPVADFAAEYSGRTIAFNSHIAAMNNHGDYDTRYDILISSGDFGETTGSGPAFQFRDVNIVSDLDLTGPNIPDTLGVQDALRVTAVVEEFDENTCLLQLDPVTTESRLQQHHVNDRL